MKRLNNKGFAISTVVYGLSIMGILIVMIVMRSMASNRTNQKEFSDAIEKELNSLSKADINFSSATDGVEEFVVPDQKSGWYRIQLWGASSNVANGAYGAYTSGIIYLNASDVLYFHIGKSLSNKGEATDVRIRSGDYKDKISYETRIMVAAGGGGSDLAQGGTLVPYQKGLTATVNSINAAGALKANTTLNGTVIESVTLKKSEDYDGLAKNFQGGDGFFTLNDKDVGGTSYISGYGGKSLINGSLSDNPSYTHYNKHYDNGTSQWVSEGAGKNYYFLDPVMIPGVNYGSGRARITPVQIIENEINESARPTLVRQNQKLDNIKSIYVCGINNSQITTNYKFSVMGITKSGGKVIEKKYSPTINSLTISGKPCKSLGLASNGSNIPPIQIDELFIYIGPDATSDIMPSYDNGIWVFTSNAAASASANLDSLNKIKYTTLGYTETMTPTGIHISAYQPDYFLALNTGDYYIQPVTSENRFVAGKETSSPGSADIQLNLFADTASERWAVEKVGTGNSYRLRNLQKGYYLTYDLKLVAPTPSNTPPVWTIEPFGDGTYGIKDNSGNYLVQAGSDSATGIGTSLTKTSTASNVTRFKFRSFEYTIYG